MKRYKFRVTCFAFGQETSKEYVITESKLSGFYQEFDSLLFKIELLEIIED